MGTTASLPASFLWKTPGKRIIAAGSKNAANGFTHIPNSINALFEATLQTFATTYLPANNLDTVASKPSKSLTHRS
jgi:hypothetical protein